MLSLVVMSLLYRIVDGVYVSHPCSLLFEFGCYENGVEW